jgi:hypothetical protein
VSEKKQSTKTPAGNGSSLLEALEELLTKIKQHQTKLPKGILEAAQNLSEELGDLTNGMPKGEREALAAGLRKTRDQRGKRNDKSRVPAGYVFEDGYLRTAKPFIIGGGVKPPQTRRDELLALNVVRAVEWWAKRRELAKPKHRAALEAAFEAIFGYPFGERWRESLILQLENQWRLREETRLQQRKGRPKISPEFVDLFRKLDDQLAKEGGPSVVDRIATGAELLAFIGEMDAVPKGLTAQAIDDMFKRVGGRGGKTARKVVEEFAAGVRKKKSD